MAGERPHCLCASASGRRLRPAMDARIFSLCSSDSGPRRRPAAPLQSTEQIFDVFCVLDLYRSCGVSLHAHLPAFLLTIKNTLQLVY